GDQRRAGHGRHGGVANRRGPRGGRDEQEREHERPGEGVGRLFFAVEPVGDAAKTGNGGQGYGKQQGVEGQRVSSEVIGEGGTEEIDGIKFTIVNAFHSGSAPDGSYGGEPAGIVITFENGTAIYFAGDTCVFGDMQLIGRIYDPDVAVLPIGGHFTMDPRE